MSELVISTPEEWLNFVNSSQAGTADDILKVSLANDIDFKDVIVSSYINSRKSYTDFDGQGHTFKNMVYNHSNSNFNFLNFEGLVQNVKFSNNFISVDKTHIFRFIYVQYGSRPSTDYLDILDIDIEGTNTITASTLDVIYFSASNMNSTQYRRNKNIKISGTYYLSMSNDSNIFDYSLNSRGAISNVAINITINITHLYETYITIFRSLVSSTYGCYCIVNFNYIGPPSALASYITMLYHFGGNSCICCYFVGRFSSNDGSKNFRFTNNSADPANFESFFCIESGEEYIYSLDTSTTIKQITSQELKDADFLRKSHWPI